MQTKIMQIEKKIRKIKEELGKINSMRPGSLTKQYKNSKEKRWVLPDQLYASNEKQD